VPHPEFTPADEGSAVAVVPPASCRLLAFKLSSRMLAVGVRQQFGGPANALVEGRQRLPSARRAVYASRMVSREGTCFFFRRCCCPCCCSRRSCCCCRCCCPAFRPSPLRCHPDRGRFLADEGSAVSFAVAVVVAVGVVVALAVAVRTSVFPLFAVSLYAVIPREAAFWPTRDLLWSSASCSFLISLFAFSCILLLCGDLPAGS
jgi:hypothetical protein